MYKVILRVLGVIAGVFIFNYFLDALNSPSWPLFIIGLLGCGACIIWIIFLAVGRLQLRRKKDERHEV